MNIFEISSIIWSLVKIVFGGLLLLVFVVMFFEIIIDVFKGKDE